MRIKSEVGASGGGLIANPSRGGLGHFGFPSAVVLRTVGTAGNKAMLT